jgi:hypothetical protein
MKATRYFSHDNWSPSLDLNSGPPKYEAGNQMRSVTNILDLSDYQ